MNLNWLKSIGACLLLFGSHLIMATELIIYIDSDFSHHQQSAKSIEAGVKAALSQIDYRIGEHTIAVVNKDHRGNTARSKRHYKQLLDDQNGLLMIGGLHSPPLIKNQAFINENQLLTLVPWAAAGPITRPSSLNNWVFRLSIDDTIAGRVISRFAMEQKQCERPHIFLEKTPWGQSNYRTMKSQLPKLTESDVSWFNWGIDENKLAIMLRAIKSRNADCLLFVGNAVEGKKLVKTMVNNTTLMLPIYSHWGITGGDFHLQVGFDARKTVQLHFIQSCFSFLSSPQSTISKRAEQQYSTLSIDGLPKSIMDLSAPTGFIHAYDLTQILIHAIKQSQLSDDMAENRRSVKRALENITSPVEGLIKTYHTPFKPYTEVGSAQHEALSIDDFCMGHYNQQDQVVLDTE